MKVLKICKLKPDAIIPSYAHDSDSGMDLHAIGNYTLQPGKVVMVSTGIAIQLEKGYEAQIRPRSGLACKNTITVINSPGTIDAGYTGEILIGLYNSGNFTYRVNNLDKVAQMVICPVLHPVIEIVDNLIVSERGGNGFGSTGK